MVIDTDDVCIGKVGWLAFGNTLLVLEFAKQ